jgi:heme-degrading monooxygenase HmoA
MIVKVMIKREVKKGKEKKFFEALKEFRVNAMDQPGYITGETLICADMPSKVMVISQWESIEDWQAWKNSDKNKELSDTLASFQKNKTVYEPYVYKKWLAAADLGFPPPLQKMKL